MHEKGVLHRDLKADNVLLDRQGRAKVSDLGLAQVDALLQKREPVTTAIGLQDSKFIAPERAKDLTMGSKATDIYALGLVLWELASGKEPRRLAELDFAGLFEPRAQGNLPEREPIPVDCPPAFKQLILDCWHPNPSKRPTAKAVITWLQ